jgi:hypothetical protein
MLGPVRFGKLRHVQSKQFAFQFDREPPREVALPGAGWAGEQEDPNWPAALFQRQTAANMRGQFIAYRVLTDHLCFEPCREGIGVYRDGLEGLLQRLVFVAGHLREGIGLLLKRQLRIAWR